MQVTNQHHSLNQLLLETTDTTAKLTSKATFSDYMMALQATAATKSGDTESVSKELTFSMDTSKGTAEINLDDYFEPKSVSADSINLLDIPLLLPSAHNVDTLAKYSENKVKELMQQYNIPKPPATIEFDQEGQLMLPKDYPYSAQLKHAFNENPQVEEALRTTTALASHYAGIMEAQPFRDEMSTARTQADRDRIVEKYSYLFDDNRPPVHIVLAFLDDGSMLVGGRSSASNYHEMFKLNS